MADALFERGNMEHILVVCAEEPTRMVDWTKRDTCLLYTSDAADDLLCVDLGGRRSIQKKHQYNCTTIITNDSTSHDSAHTTTDTTKSTNHLTPHLT